MALKIPRYEAPPTPPKAEPTTDIITARIPKELLELVQREASRLGYSTSGYVRCLLELQFTRAEKKR